MTVPFLTDQRLSLLDLGHPVLTHLDVAAAEKRRDRGGFQPEGTDSPWKILPRADWQTRMTSDLRRVVLVGDAGLGKTSNCEWMAGTLHLVQRGLVPFLLPIEKLPESADDAAVFPVLLAQWRLARGCSESQFPWEKARRMLVGLRASGRLVLVLDSLDQALSRPKAVETLTQLMKAADWKACPLVVSTRPHALSSQWKTVFAPVENEFRFVRIEEMDEPQQKHLLGTITLAGGTNLLRYELIPREGGRLLGVPRVIELIRNLGNDRAAYTNLKTMTDVYWTCMGMMLRQGLKADTAGDRLEWSPADGPVPDEHRPYQVDVARSILGAVAFEMYAGTDGRPNLAHVPAAEMAPFLTRVQIRMSKARREHERHERDEQVATLGSVDRRPFTVNFNAVAAMNAGALENYFLDVMDESRELKFRNPTMQAFFAAIWVCRHGTPDDLERLKSWVVSLGDDRFGWYEEFWRFVSELGDTGAWDTTAVRNDLWVDVIGVVYRSRVRMCEFIYRSWKRMDDLKAKARDEFLDEFPAIRRGEQGPEKKQIADNLMSGFIPLAVPGSTLPRDTGTFLMGSPKSETFHQADEFQHEVTLTPFRMSRAPVTNEEYELFDPGHKKRQAWKEQPFIARHPVMNVDWWEAWCYCRWVGGRLPTEAEWEYACRGGSTTPYYWGDTLNGTEANCNGIDFFTNEAGKYLGRTTAVGEYETEAPKLHPWGLVDVHGNVWEWCADWSGPYSDEAQVKNPVGPKDGSHRVCRGGGWSNFAWFCRSAFRIGYSPGYLDFHLGFRLAAGPSGIK